MKESATASVASTNVLGIAVQNYHANYLEISTSVKLLMSSLPSLANALASLSKGA
jgi:hypothetical protein